VTNDIPNASPRGRAPARRQKSISPADYVLTFTPEGNGRLPAKAVELLLAVAQRAKIPERSRGEFSRHFGPIIDEANRTPIGRRRISGKEINLAFDRITNSVQRLHAKLVELEKCADFNSAEYFVARHLRASLSDFPDSWGQRGGIQHFLQLLDSLAASLECSKKSIAPFTSRVGRPRGGNLAFDTFIADLWLAVRSNGGKLTIYKSPEGRWAGTALDIVDLLRPHLPKRNFVPGNLGSSLNRIITRWKHATDSSQPGKFIEKSTARKSSKKSGQ
jgi:hypothetical protein